MQADFWHERWQTNQIGFHQGTINDYLQRSWSQLRLASGQVFVPLCGKSRDMVWLVEQGHSVLGIELDRLAVDAFFEEQQLTPTISKRHGFEYWQTGPYTLLCGDFFALSAHQLSAVTAVYDRAALVAMPPDMRPDYAEKMTQLLPDGTSLLLITFEYDQNQMNGPPFAVLEPEVQCLFGAWSTLSRIASKEALFDNPRFRAKGLSALQESAYLLRR